MYIQLNKIQLTDSEAVFKQAFARGTMQNLFKIPEKAKLQIN